MKKIKFKHDECSDLVLIIYIIMLIIFIVSLTR